MQKFKRKNVMRFAILFTILAVAMQTIAAEKFDIVTPSRKVSIVFATDGPRLDSISAVLLADDIELVSGYRPLVTGNIARVSGNVIMIGNIRCKLIKSLKDAYFNRLDGKWECYSHKVIHQPFKNIRQALVIAGSDSRGTAYGVFGISEKIGVSPWYWWADVHPEKKQQLTLDISAFTSSPPSVKFRGIFINDEDWGLQPWAAKTYEPETKDIGPKTYAKVFELLLRLKGNLIWPAMHSSTKPFYHYPGNEKVAADYEIVVSSSHAEPMLRSNVGEWNEKTDGHFNYITNQQNILNYWESRVKQSKGNNVIYTIGMRGVHDSGMEGVKNAKEAVPLLTRIFKDQRNLLGKHINQDVTKVPQAFAIYKEVLDIYDLGLKVPEDVTLIWPDDNYGYVQRLSNKAENERAGGSGVYYHVSYWGRPHDYLWLATTHPALLREEMTKAYEMNARNIWVLNVGDIKPSEYAMQLFMDMAFDVKPFFNPAYSKTHLVNWMGDVFGKSNAIKTGDVLWKYYDLSFERKPEFMGWSRTEPTTKTTLTQYNPVAYGDQVQQRIGAYDLLERQVKNISGNIPDNRKDAFYELVDYPVTGASLMNKKFLYRDKAALYALLGGLDAKNYAQLSDSAYREIKEITAYYNSKLADGKWNGMMSMAPRKLPVFDSAGAILSGISGLKSVLIIPENGLLKDSSGIYRSQQQSLLFDRWNRQKHFIDVVLQRDTSVHYNIRSTAAWIKSPSSGILQPGQGNSNKRIWVEIDWLQAPRTQLEGNIIISYGNDSDTVALKADNRSLPELDGFKGFIASGDYIAMNAGSFTGKKQRNEREWKVIEGLGSAGNALEAMPLTFDSESSRLDTAAIRNNASVVYDFYTFNAANATCTITTLPTFPLNNQHGMRYAVSIDNGSLNILDFKTVGRTEEWKKNVLSNTAERSVTSFLNAGKHTLTIYMIDPGVIIDRLFINLGNRQTFYGAIPETTFINPK